MLSLAGSVLPYRNISEPTEQLHSGCQHTFRCIQPCSADIAANLLLKELSHLRPKLGADMLINCLSACFPPGHDDDDEGDCWAKAKAEAMAKASAKGGKAKAEAEAEAEASAKCGKGGKAKAAAKAKAKASAKAENDDDWKRKLLSGE